MTCTYCDAGVDKLASFCRVCGAAAQSAQQGKWDRAPVSAAYGDLTEVAGEGETILAATRGKLVGAWKDRIQSNPIALLSPYANVGITSHQLILQAINSKSGTPLPGKPCIIPISQVRQIECAAADALEPSLTTRLRISLGNEDSIRLKSFGRMARESERLAEVWHAVAGVPENPSQQFDECRACRRPLDRVYRFCPFCGAPGEED